MNYFSILLIAHLFGVIIAAGAAFTGDNIFFRSMKDRRISREEFGFIKMSGTIVWSGLIVLLISGTLMFLQNVDGYLASSKFILKMIIVAVIAVNGLFFRFVHMKFFENFVNRDISDPEFQKRKFWIFASGGISAISWPSAILLGALPSIPLSVPQGLLIYIVGIFISVFFSQIISRKYI